jgi:large conductance mechanosensitive channel
MMLRGFRNFLMQGELIVIAVGLVVALAFSTLIKSFTDSIITPLINAAGGGGTGANGLGWTINGQRIDLGAFFAAIIYFIIFMAVVYFVLVVPYRAYMKKQGKIVFGDPAPSKECPSCLSDGLPLAATKCRFCGTDVPPVPSPV